jgi:hypothetical protein
LTEDPLSASYDAFVAGDEPNRCDKLLAGEKIVNDPSISTLNNEMKFLSFLANYHKSSSVRYVVVYVCYLYVTKESTI